MAPGAAGGPGRDSNGLPKVVGGPPKVGLKSKAGCNPKLFAKLGKKFLAASALSCWPSPLALSWGLVGGPETMTTGIS